MKRILTAGVVALCAAAILTTAALAERAQRPARGQMGSPACAMGMSGDREGGRGKMEAMMVKMLGKRLELDSATAEKLGAIIKKNMRERDKAMREMRRATEDLEDLIEDDAADNRIAAQVKALKERRQAMAAVQEQLFDQVQSLLGTRKTAEFIVLQQQMMERMREQVRKRGQQGQQSQRGQQGQRSGNAQRGAR